LGKNTLSESAPRIDGVGILARRHKAHHQSTVNNDVRRSEENGLMNKDRKRVAVVGGLTGIVVALVLGVTHNDLVTPAKASSKTTQTTVSVSSNSTVGGNGAGYFRGFDRLDDVSTVHPPHVM
jgi:hypothetical protein